MLKILANKHAVVLTAALLMSGFAALPVCAGQTNAAQNADDKEIAMLKQRVDEQERMINDLLRFNSPAKFHHHMRSVFCAGRHSVQRADAGADGRFRPDERIR